MKLVKIRIRNFRCFKEEVSVSFEDITALIGKNDAGKSTILDALNLFLNDECPDKNDPNVQGDAKDVTIICEFSDLPDEIIIDEDSATTLKEEYLLNGDNNLEIHKTFNGSLANPKLSNLCLYAQHPTNESIIDLLQLKISDLKKRAKELSVDLKKVDQTISAQLRKAIRGKIKDLKVDSTFIPLNENNGIKVWNGLKTYLPIFALFKSDRESSDQDPEAQDPLKVAIKEAIKDKEKEIEKITEYIKEEVNKITKDTLEKLSEMDPSLAKELKAEIVSSKFENIFKSTIKCDDNIPINKRGSGIKRLILLSFFRAKAEQKMNTLKNTSVIYAFEEPETSQHPNNQRILMSAFIELSLKSQIIISTHTPMLARVLNEECLRFIKVNDDKSREIISGNNIDKHMLAIDLGILPDNSVKLFIGVEGKNDITFIKNINKVLIEAGEDIIDLEKMEIEGELIFFPLGGSNLALWTSRLKNLNRPEFHLYDRDNQPPEPSKYHEAIDEINQRENCNARCTNKKEIENYIHKDVIIQAYGNNRINIQIPNNFADFDDVGTEIAKLVHSSSASNKTWEQLDEEERDRKISKAKTILNRDCSKLMTRQMINEIDNNGEILNWFAEMKGLIQDH